MSKDNFISAMFGVLLGFIAGYVMHELLVSRQPPRLPAGMSTTTAAAPDQAGEGGQAGEAPQAPFAGGAPGGAPSSAPGAGPAAGGAPGGGAPMIAEVRDLEARISANPQDADAIRRLGDLNFDISNWQKAHDLYTKYLEIKPGDPDVMTDLGVTYRGLKQFDRALEIFGQVAKAAPDHWQSRYNEVVILAFDLNKMDDAKQALAELQRLQPNNEKVAQLAAAMEKRKAA